MKSVRARTPDSASLLSDSGQTPYMMTMKCFLHIFSLAEVTDMLLGVEKIRTMNCLLLVSQCLSFGRWQCAEEHRGPSGLCKSSKKVKPSPNFNFIDQSCPKHCLIFPKELFNPHECISAIVSPDTDCFLAFFFFK